MNNGVKNRYRFLHKSAWYRSDRLAFANILASLCVGIAAIVIAVYYGKASIKEAEAISQQEVRIQKFDTLVKSSWKTNDQLRVQLTILDSLLAIANQNNINRIKTSRVKLAFSANKLNYVCAAMPATNYYLFSQNEINNFIDSTVLVLNEFADNEYLFTDNILAQKWSNLCDSVYQFKKEEARLGRVAAFYNKEQKGKYLKVDEIRLADRWKGCYFGVLAFNEYLEKRFSNSRTYVGSPTKAK